MHNVIIIGWGGVVSTIFCGTLAGEVSRLRPKRNSAYHNDRGPVALAVLSAVEVRDMRGWSLDVLSGL